MDCFLYPASTLAAIISLDANARILYNTSPCQPILAHSSAGKSQYVCVRIVCSMDTDTQDSDLTYCLCAREEKHLSPLPIHSVCKLAGSVSLPGIYTGCNTMMVTFWVWSSCPFSGFLSLSRFSLFCVDGLCLVNSICFSVSAAVLFFEGGVD